MTRLRQVARLALVLFLVPVVIFSTPTHAAAAESQWGSTTVPIAVQGAGDLDCWVSASYVDDTKTAVQWGEGRCLGGMDTTPGWKQIGEPGTMTTLFFSGTDAAGNACAGGGLAGTGGDHPSDSFSQTAMTIPGGSGALSGDGCTISEVCVMLNYDVLGPGGVEEKGCGAISIPDGSETGCEWGTPTYVNGYTEDLTGSWEGYTNYWIEATVADAVTPIDPGLAWYFDAYSGVTWQRLATEMRAGSQSPTFKDRSLWTDDQQNALTAAEEGTGGIQIAGPGSQNSEYHDQMPGITDPANCIFWFGPKIKELPDTDVDIPYGDMNEDTQPPTSSPPVPPGEDDPMPADEPSWWEAVLRALASIAKSIAGIAEAILDGLLGLFVPSEGFLDGKVDSAKDAWASTPPFVVMDGVGDLADALTIPPPAGCQGPEMNITTEFTGPVSLHPLSACAEEVGLLASIVKTALTVTVYVGAFLAAVRMIGSSLGLDISLGKGSEE